MANVKAEPECPKCHIKGLNNIESSLGDIKGGAMFMVVYCKQCGHVYGVVPTEISTR